MMCVFVEEGRGTCVHLGNKVLTGMCVGREVDRVSLKIKGNFKRLVFEKIKYKYIPQRRVLLKNLPSKSHCFKDQFILVLFRNFTTP